MEENRSWYKENMQTQHKKALFGKQVQTQNIAL